MSKPDLTTRTRLAVGELLDRVLSGVVPRHSATSSRALDLSELEERILLSASPVMAVAEMADATLVESSPVDSVMMDTGTDPSAETQSSVASEYSSSNVTSDPSQTATRELVFLDTSVEDYQTLLNDLWAADDPGRDIEVILLSNSRDGIEQISETLAGRSDIDSVHFVTHGTDRAVKLGATWLTNDNLAGYVGEMARWGDALAVDADLLFYGCNLAGSDAGLTLLESVQTLTGADIAASTNDTGAAVLGGDWVLEAELGSIESTVVFSEIAQANWHGLLNTFTVTNTNDSGAGSLRQAITDANSLGGADTIEFSLTGGEPYIINIASALPTISDSVVIDGWSEDEWGNSPIIVLNGSGAGAAHGLSLTAGNSTIRGLVIQNFGVNGILLNSGASNNTIVGNYIGTDATGSVDQGNGSHGISINNNSNNNTIGGTGANEQNVISGNNSSGININNGSSGNTVIGNIIGLNAAGTGDLGNTNHGIIIGNSSAASNNIIGGTTTAERNIIAGNNGAGVRIKTGTGNVVQGNYIGTDITGAVDLGNSEEGIHIESAGNTVGGSVSGAGNVISGNTQDGVQISGAGATSNIVAGNLIGLNAAGTGALSNDSGGVRIDLGGSNNTIGGDTALERNVISGNAGVGVELDGAVSNILSGNYIGTDINGTAAIGNTQGILFDDAAVSNIIGGTTAGERNVISGNLNEGVLITDTGTTGNVVSGNYIGVDVSGAVDLGNADDGVQILGGATNNTIGGTTAAERNVISGNDDEGVEISGTGTSGNVVLGNYIGVDATGASAIGNSNDGVLLEAGATNNTIGGTAAGSGNVISGVGQDGIRITGIGTSSNLVQGNYIGTNAAGTAVVGNTRDGVKLEAAASGNTIGGDSAAARNVISGNRHGVDLTGSGTADNIIQGNYIGTDAAGTGSLGNLESGVYVSQSAADNLIGGTEDGEGNLIAFNSDIGVRVTSTAGAGNSILRNSIHSNTALGIDLDPAGVTANDIGDTDIGPNSLQNYPVLESAFTDGSSTVAISGTLNSAALTTFRLEFFSNSGGGNEGETYLGYRNVITNSSGDVTFVDSFSATVTTGDTITATATNLTTGDTSEFSAGVVSTEALIVDTTSDVVDGDTTSINSLVNIDRGTDGKISLREAIIAANNTAGHDGIFLSADTYTLTIAGQSENFAATGDLNIRDSLSVIGAGAGSTIIDGSDLDRIFQTYAGDDVFFEGLTIQNATANGDGAGLNVSGTVVVADSVFQDNVTAVGGHLGGAISTNSGSSLFLDSVRITNNTSGDSAGGLYLTGSAHIVNSLIDNNTASGVGGGFYENGSGSVVSLVNSTLSTNTAASDGGGAYVTDSVEFVHSTITNNTATSGSGGGIYNLLGPGVVTFSSSIIAGNTSSSGGPDINGPLTSGGYNIIGDTTGNAGWVGSDQQNVAPSLETLSDNGGLTQTHALLVGSAAINAGDPTSTIAVDQRGELRTDGVADVGAFEFAPDSLVGHYMLDEGSGTVAIDSSDYASDGTHQDSPTHATGIINGALDFSGDFDRVEVADPADGHLDFGSGDFSVSFWFNSTQNDASQARLIGKQASGGTPGFVFYRTNSDLTFSVGDGSSTAFLTATGVMDGQWHDVTGIRSGNVFTLYVDDVAVDSATVAVGSIDNAEALKIGASSGSTGDFDGLIDDVRLYGRALSIAEVMSTNDAPTITSDGGGPTAAINVAENTTAVTTVTATDSDVPMQTLSYSITGGADAAKFSINSSTGALTFASAPDFESPTDANTDNVYEVTVQVSDGNGGTDSQGISVTVTNSGQTTIVVDTASDVADGTTTSIAALLADMGADGKISLREAILATNSSANEEGGADRIHFNILDALVAGAHTIVVGAGGLPNITDAIIIDGTTDADFAGTPIIVLDGSGAGVGIDGLTLTDPADGSTIRGLVVHSFDGYGIDVDRAASTVIAGNFIGTDVTGAVDMGNGSFGVRVNLAADVTIGGSTAADRNVIAGNDNTGIFATGASTTNITISGNFIGLNATGTAALGNAGRGINFANDASGTVGGLTAGERNVISGNGNDAVRIGSNTTVIGNYIGTDASGTSAIANTGVGIHVQGNNSTVGGATAAHRNVISGNTLHGVYIDEPADATANTIEGNYIGVDVTGNVALANDGDGIHFLRSAGNFVIDNVISANAGHGIELGGSGGNIFEGNLIGVGADGTTALGNGADGIWVKSDDNRIGGTDAGDGNVIANSASNRGIRQTTGTGNSFLGNVFHDNSYLAIDLAQDGPDANDNLDADVGPNNHQNYPVISSALTDGSATVQINGTLNSEASTQYRIEFFSNVTQDATGFGEAETYLGSTTVTTDGSGDASFTANLSVLLADGDYVTATATKIDNAGQIGVDDSAAYGDTSEFSANVQATPLAANTAPTFTGLDNSPTFVEGGSAVVLDADVEIFDAELSAIDDFNGATLGIVRNGGAAGDDVFNFVGNLSALGEGQPLVLSAVTIGTVTTNSGGTLLITFNGNATQARVNEAMRSIAYANFHDTPPASVQLDWTFDDGNSGSQGPGGALTATGSTTVNIQSAPDVAITAPATAVTNEDTAFVYSGANVVSVSDGLAGDNPLRVSLSVANGTLTLASTTGITIVEGADGSSSLVLDGLESDLNTALDGLMFTPDENHNGADTLNITTAIAADLQGHYTFDGGNALDQSAGTADDGTLNGNATTIIDGTRGEVLSLDGTNGTSVSVSGKFGQPASVTLAAWVNLTAAGTTGSEVIALGADFGLRLDDSDSSRGLMSYAYNGTNWDNATTGIFIAGTGWRHVAVTFDDATGTQRLYLDGLEVGSLTSGNSITYQGSTPDTIIGKHPSPAGHDYNFNGLIDDAHVYGRALSAEEIAALATDATSINDSVAITVSAVNDAPSFLNLDGNPTFTEGGAAVVLDADVNVSDVELDALNGGAGNYSGASLTIARDGGVNADDVLSFSDGNGITKPANELIKNGQIIATFDTTSTPGRLVVNFTDANGEIPTSTDVDNILRQIIYANSSDTPPSSVDLSWSFLDGNLTNLQGSGGLKFVDGTTTVNITAVNDAPTDLVVTSTTQDGLSLNEDGGNDAYLKADDGGAILGGLSRFTFETRVQFTGTSHNQELLSYMAVNGSDALRFSILTNGNMLIQIANVSVQSSAFDYHTLGDGEIHTISVTWDNAAGDWEVFVDGASVDSDTGHPAAGQTIAAGGTLVIGQEQDTVDGGYQSGEFFEGTLHDVRIFGDVRTPGEISAGYATTLPYDESGLLANWTFDALSTGGVVTDAVNANNLTVSHASGGGFLSSTPALELTVDENASNGTVVGSLTGVDPERDGLIADLLAADPNLYYSAETGKFYEFDVTPRLFADAHAFALGSSLNGVAGQLVIVESAAENALVGDILATEGVLEVYLGITDATTEGEWRYLEAGVETQQFWSGDFNGSRVNGLYSSWNAGEPNNVGEEDHATVHTAGTWNDVDGTSTFMSVLIEYDADAVLDNAGPAGEQPLTYSVQSQTVAGTFAINSDTGEITVADGSLLDFETAPTHTVTVRVTDVDSATYDEAVTISLSNVNEAPLNSVPAAQTVAKNNDLVFSAGNGNAISISDVDAGSDTLQLDLTATNGTVDLNIAGKVGGETLVNTTTASTQNFSNAAIVDGVGSVVVWSSINQDGSSYGVYAQLYDADGNASGGEIAVNTTTAQAQFEADVALDSSGNFVVVWKSENQDGDSGGIYARRFNSGGTAISAEVAVNSTTAGDQTLPEIAMRSNGDFVVVWQSETQDGDGFGIYGQRFFASMAQNGGEFLINTTTVDAQQYASVDMDDSGNFVVAWESNGQDGSGTSVQFQRFDSTGTKQGSETQANTTTTSSQSRPEVAVDSDGDFVIVWYGEGPGDTVSSGGGIFGQRFDSSGVAQGSEFRINETTTNTQVDVDVSSDSAGNFQVVWESYSQDGDLSGIYSRRYDSAGNALTPEFQVNTITNGSQADPTVAVSASGESLVTWHGPVTGDADGVALQRFTPVSATFNSGDGIDDASVSVTATLDDLNVLLDGLTFHPTTSFTGAASLQIDIDDQGNTGTGGSLTDSDVINITVFEPTPILDLDADNSVSSGLNFAATWTEGSGPTLIADSDASVTDPDSANLSSLTVTISNRLDGTAEVLAADTSGTSIIANYDTGTGVLTLSGSDTVSNYEQVLRTVTYDNTSDAPNTTARSITFVASDGTNVSPAGITTVTMNATNDAPVITSNGGGSAAAINVAENSTAVTTITVTDPDGGTPTFTLISGADQAKFAINSSTGALTFQSAPDFETPTDVGADNVYEVVVLVTDGNGGTDTQSIDVTVTNVGQSTIVVDTTSDVADGTTSSIAALLADMGADGKISLREAITAANNTFNEEGGADQIHFSISDPLVSGAHTISLTSALPSILDAVIIDGSTEPDYAGSTPVIALDGTSAGGTTRGIHLNTGSDGSTIRGLAIHSFGDDGIHIVTDNNTIVGNFVGTNATGTVALGNGDDGIHLHSGASGNIIGGATAAERNIIANSTSDGIIIQDSTSDSNNIIGNYIGTDVTGTLDFGNGAEGIRLLTGVDNTQIGGTGAGEGNLIAYSGGIGISVEGSAHNNPILGNLIHSNISFEIDLARDGITNNDAGDGDTNANDRQNYPVLTTATTNGTDTISVDGSLNSTASTAFRLEFFASATAAASGHGGAERFLGSTSVTTDGSGNATFSEALSATVATGELITATTTVDLGDGNYGDTSEFAANVMAVQNSASPVITSNGGGATAPINVAENTTAVTTVTATDTDLPAQTLSYSITGGADLARFNINSSTGVLTFISAPDFETPTDVGANNVYDVTVQVSDGAGGTDSQDLSVTVTDIGNTVVVTTTSDTADGNTTSIEALYADKGADGVISLREAILATNATANIDGSTPDVIEFALSLSDTGHLYYQDNGAAGFAAPVVTTLADGAISDFDADYTSGTARSWWRIAPTSSLPSINEAIIIDGTTQAGFNNLPIIELEGSTAGFTDGLYFNITSSSSAVRGLVINSFGDDGIEATGSNYTFTGNYIGTDVSGTVAAGNGDFGLHVSASSQIGGTTAGDGNLISGNTGAGVQLVSGSNIVEGNLIGTDVTGVNALGNGDDGVLIGVASSLNRIGGLTDAGSNVIAFNGGNGVTVLHETDGNAIRSNSIHSNTGIGIDLGDDGVTVNVNNDPWQNMPTLTSAVFDGTDLSVSGTVSTTPFASIKFDIYISPSADPSGYGEGTTYVGTVTTSSNIIGNANFSQSFTVNVPAGSVVTATDTGPGNYTSEFSLARTIEFHPQLDLDADDSSGSTGADFTASWSAAGPVAIADVDATLGDGDSANLSSVTVTVANLQDGVDELLAADTTGTSIIAAGGAGGTLTLSGVDSVANYQQVLRTLTYDNIAASPTLGTRTITIIASDGTHSSNTGTATITMSGGGTAPSIDLDGDNSSGATTPNFSATFTEDGGSVFVADSDAVLADADSTNLTSLTVTITNLQDGANEILSADTSGTAISANYNSGTGVLSLTGVDSVANYETVLRTVKYDHSSEAPDTTDRVITFVASDGTAASVAATTTLTVVATNDAPQATVPVSVALNEDATAAISMSVNDVDLQGGDIQVGLQVDNGDLTLASTAGLTFIAGDGTNDAALTFRGSLANINAAVASITYRPNQDFNGADTFGWIVDDLGNSPGPALQTQSTVPITVNAVNDTPEITAPASLNATEQTPLAIHGGSFSLTDVDAAAGTLTATLSVGEGTLTVAAGDSGATIDSGNGTGTVVLSGTLTDLDNLISGGSTGTITYLNSSDTPAASTTLTITVNDGGNTGADPGTSGDGTSEQGTSSVTINIAAVNDDPTITSSASASVPENTTAVLTVTSSDVDGGSPAYAITGGADAASFSINSSTGELTFASAPDFESPTDADTDNVYEVTVEVSDGAGGTDSQAISVTVTDVDEFDIGSVTDSDAADNTVAENATVGTTVGLTASASDDDATTNAITYSLDDDAGGLFAINSSTGVVTVNAALDYETTTSHNVTVRATSADTSFSTQSFSISVTDVNESGVSAISDSDGGADFVLENSAGGTAVGITAFADDADGTDSVSYSLDDNAGGRFAINSSTGEVTVFGGIDRESAGSYGITVRATSTDTSFTTKAFTISIGDVDEFDVSSPTDTDGTADAVNENAANGTTVGITASASDADATTNGITYSLFDDAGGRFAINSSTGIVTVADGTQLDREAAASHNITVRATSDDGSTADTTFTISLNDVDEFDVGSVTDSDAADNTVAEDATVGTTVGLTASASDDDATTNAITYSLDDDAGGLFAINSSTGIVTVNAALDYETATSHNVTVRATSADTSFSTQSFSISVTDVNESGVSAISDSDGGADFVLENSANGTSVGITAFADDADGTDSVSYSLDDNAGGRFAINSSTGEVTVAGALDREAGGSYGITVRATSTDTSFTTKAFTISIGDVDEFDVSAPTDTDGTADAVNENAANGTTVGITASASDADATTNGITYSLFDDAGGRFAINSSTGIVTVNAALDYETATSHNVTVRATSDDGSFSTKDFTITVNDLDEFDITAINDADATLDNVDENATVGTTVGITAFASDADATTNGITYSLDDDSAGQFAIDGSSGEVTVAGAIDRETGATRSITVRATSEDGSSSTKSFTIAINDLDEFDITAISDSDGGVDTVNENAAVGVSVGIRASASDADSTTNTITYSLDDDSNGEFFIEAAAGDVKVAGPIDREAGATRTITVRATSADGSFSTKDFTIAINDLNDNAPVIDLGQSFDVSEFASNGDSVGTATATDADTVGTIQNWAITGGNVDNIFEIDSASGELRVADNSLLNFETTATYILSLRVEDGANTSSIQTVTVNVGDENDVPILDVNAGISVVEGSDVIISSAELSVSDEDELAEEIQYTIVNAPTVGRLERTSDPGVSISTFTQADIDNNLVRFVHDGSEADDSFTFSISDGSGGTIGTTLFSITNLRVNDAPVNAVPISQTTAEDTPLVFSSAGGNSIAVSDVDLNGGLIGVQLVATNGVLTLGSTAGLTFAAGDGTSDTSMVFAGTIGDVNAALDGLTFDPAADYNGPATVQLVSRDMGSSGSGGEQIDDDTIDITVVPVNDTPVAIDDDFSIDEDNTLTVSAASGLLSNDSDIDGDSLAVVAVTGTANGALSLNADGSFVYTPNTNFNGVDTFTYRATDGSLQSETRTVTLNVAAVNDASVSVDDQFVIDQLTVLELSAANGVLINDLDVEADTLQAVLVDGPQNGQLVLNADGSLTYTPNATFFGEDVFTYRSLDGTDDGSIATVRITVRQTVTSGGGGTDGGDGDGTSNGDGDGNSTGDGNIDQTGETGTDEGPTGDGTTGDGTVDGSDNSAPNDLLTNLPTDTSTTDPEDAADETRETSSETDMNQNDGSQLDHSSYVVALRIDDRGELRDRLSGRIVEDAGVVVFTSTDVGSMVYVLEQTGFWTELDTFEQDVQNAILQEGEWEELVVETTTVAGTTLTVGYIVWLLRSGSVVFGLVSSLPAWTMMDPLPVLQSGLETLGNTDDSDDDSLQGILQAHHDGLNEGEASFEGS